MDRMGRPRPGARFAALLVLQGMESPTAERVLVDVAPPSLAVVLVQTTTSAAMTSRSAITDSIDWARV
ncbi:hypothetical protein FB558_0059 [Pseudonocardia kunmingensis]|uniref:Uncharacterized protein n=1 Tax=Pseudonocardia kunmingensis TaxID=630975 RepID=A0A543DVH8_9PSEU|nr:hypothetical protein FB558_0059 [Pseudonocardia kunmingensis]